MAYVSVSEKLFWSCPLLLFGVKPDMIILILIMTILIKPGNRQDQPDTLQACLHCFPSSPRDHSRTPWKHQFISRFLLDIILWTVARLPRLLFWSQECGLFSPPELRRCTCVLSKVCNFLSFSGTSCSHLIELYLFSSNLVLVLCILN